MGIRVELWWNSGYGEIKVYKWMSVVCNFDTDLTKCTNKVTFDTGNVRLYAIFAMI